MNTTIIILLILILLAVVFLLFQNSRKNTDSLIAAMRDLLRYELKENRSELSAALKENREELAFGLDNLTHRLEEKLTQISDGVNKNAKESREELARS
jgi:DNA recombination protein RmuC